ncbi:IS66 family transposase [Clostridiaceae bacterium 35-E11]
MQTVLARQLSILKESERRLRYENEIQRKRIESLERNIETLTQALLQASKKRFGASSEKTVSDQQLYIFDETEGILGEIDCNATTERLPVKAHTRLKRKKGDQERLIKALPREVVECIIDEKDSICDVCNSSLSIIGKKKVRSEIEFIPARVKVTEYVQYIYKCTTCGTCDEYPDAVIRKASVPKPVMKRSLASPTSVAWIMYQKYVLAVPLYRQEKEWMRIGIGLSRANMSNWVIQCAFLWLKPLYEQMKKQLVTYEIIMSDETTHQCNKEKGRKASSKSYFWMHRNGACEGAPIILFQYTPTRSGEHAKKFLEGFSGYLVSDAYAGYEKVDNITRCLCWTHLRRYYLEAIPLDSRKKEIPGSAGAKGRSYCDNLFSLERKWKKLSPKERKQKRLEQSIPVLNAFFEWAESVNTNQPSLKKALKYTLNHKEYFQNFLLDGRIPISNNLSENAIRPVAVARKNYLFSDTPRGAKANALVFSLIETAAANGLDPYEYLVHIFKSLPNIDFNKEPALLDDYMPWSDNLPENCYTKKQKTEPPEGSASKQ